MFVPNNNRYEILTANGFATFAGIQRKQALIVRIVDCLGATVLEATPTHKVQLDDDSFTEIKDLQTGDWLKAHGGNVIVVSHIEKVGDSFVYDPVDVDRPGHEYISNDCFSHNCEFMSNQGTLLSAKKLKELMNAYVDPVSIRPNTRIWHPAVQGKRNDPKDVSKLGEWEIEPHTYVVTVDTAEGVGGDDSVATVFDVTEMPYKICAIFQSNAVGTMEFPMFIHELCLEYNRAHLLIEVNDIGLQIADMMRMEFEYENIITTVTKERSRQVVSGGATKQIRWGLKMDKVNKRIACATLKTLVEKNQLLVQDYDTIQEFNTFIREKESYEAADGKKDDLVMGLAIFAWLTQQQYFIDLTNSNVRRQFTGLDRMEQEIAPFGIINDGITISGTVMPDVPVGDRWLVGD